MDEGMFRVSMRGFNKEDVLAYIDSLQAAHWDELQRVKDQDAALQKSLDDMKAAHDQLQSTCTGLQSALAEQEEKAAALGENLVQAGEAIKNLEQSNQSLQRQADSNREAAENYQLLEQQLREARSDNQNLQNRLVDMEAQNGAIQQTVDDLAYKAGQMGELERQVQLLREQKQWHAAERDKDLAYRQEADDKIRSLEEENARLLAEREQTAARLAALESGAGEVEAARARYNAFTENVGRFLVDLHNTGRSVLDSNYTRSAACLQAVEESVAVLAGGLTHIQGELDTARRTLQDQKTGADNSLSDMMQSLSASSETLGTISAADDKTESGEPSANREQPDDADSPEVFYR